MRKYIQILLPIAAITFLIYLPIFIKPEIILNRENDLQEFFWPIFYFVKQQIIENHTLPLWNNLFLSGTPLLPDPQAPIFYLPNIIFLLLPMGTGFIASFFLHSLIGGIGAYLAARHGFKFSKITSIFTTILYVLTPRLSGYLEAGHFGLVATTAWLPFIVLSTVKLSQKPKLIWSTIFGLSLGALFYSHFPTFIFTAVISSICFLFLIMSKKINKTSLTSIAHFCCGVFITFGLIAITLLPQLGWVPQTTRYTLLKYRDVYPKWTSITEFLKVIFIPWINGKESIWQVDTEKWLTLAILPSFFAGYGFLKIKKTLTKIGILSLGGVIILIALNNASPFYHLLLLQNWYVLARVSTRIWFVINLFVVFLAGYGFDKLKKSTKNTKLIYFISFFTICELLTLNWIRLLKPIEKISNLAPKKVYEFLDGDPERFRVFCINRCLSQQEASKYKLELVEGYSTLTQKNYYQEAWQLTGAYWDYYTLAIPPFGSYQFEELQPDAASLGEYNTKYVISPYELKDNNFILEEKIDNYLIYRNKLLKPRASAPISIYTPNHIRVNTSNFAQKQLILSEVYSPGWKAYLNGKQEIAIQETPIALRAVDILPRTEFVDFKYQPESFKVGRTITFITILLITVHGVKEYKRLKNRLFL